MRVWFLFIVVSSSLAAGCKAVDCGDGTIERDGSCVAADQTTSAARCGPFTELVGDVCKPMFPPTVCQDGTTLPDLDPMTGITTCVGTGAGACGTPIACPLPTMGMGKQTICGQLYNFETGAELAATNATGMRCTAGATMGPCALGIRAYDAIQFGMSPTTAMPLTVADTYIDDCGRYRLTDITVPQGPFIGLGIDDAMQGPNGLTNTVGVATPKEVDTATRGLEGFIVTRTTTDGWTASGGPPLSGGIYAMVFRAARTGFTNNPGVAATLAGNMIAGNDHYFTAGQATRTTIDAAASVTGANGTALVTGATVNQGINYSGTGGLPPQCAYSTHAGVSLPFIVFIQVLRPVNAPGMTCTL